MLLTILVLELNEVKLVLQRVLQVEKLILLALGLLALDLDLEMYLRW